MAREILYANDDYSVVLVDLPASIEGALGNGQQLYSCPPPEHPYPTSNEPKRTERQEKMRNAQPNQTLYDEIAELAGKALVEVKAARGEASRFCLPRCIRHDVSDCLAELDFHRETADNDVQVTALPQTRKRKAVELDKKARLQEQAGEVGNKGGHPHPKSLAHIVVDQKQFDGFAHNGGTTPKVLSLLDSRTGHSLEYHVPSSSTFLLSKCEKSNPFHKAPLFLDPRPWSGVDRFNFILLDPPWPNRSATRRKSYATVASQQSMFNLLSSLQIDSYLLPCGYVAMWTTNRAAIRDMVLGASGLFKHWGVELIEEWIWVKTTAEGEPVVALNALWRKPWEVLLVGKAPQGPGKPAPVTPTLKSRVIFAVPDLHSRKPCLKSIIEKTLLKEDAPHYNAMELFARYLVQSWLSWGDEATKYNAVEEWCNRSEV